MVTTPTLKHKPVLEKNSNQGRENIHKDRLRTAFFPGKSYSFWTDSRKVSMMGHTSSGRSA